MKRVKCLISDVDGTLIRWQLFYHLIVGMVQQGLFPRVVLARMDNALERYRNREGSFEAFIDEALKAYQQEHRLRGIRVSDLRFTARQVIAEQGKRVHVFTRELIASAKSSGYITAFISGSPTEAVEELAKTYGVDAWIGTDHPHEDGFYTGDPPKEWVRNKKEAVERLQREFSLDLEHSIAIGDSEGDVPMLKMVKHPIVFNPNAHLFSVARSNKWPIVVEKKLIFPQLFNEHRHLHVATMRRMLPQDLWCMLTLRLEALELLA